MADFIQCYQCRDDGLDGQSAYGSQFFPFCSSECKEKWVKLHYSARQAKKDITIADLQAKLMKMAESKRKTRKMPEDSDITSVAEMIFGSKALDPT